MYTKSWQIIRDDSKKTFEVQGQVENTDHFLNLVHGMQKLGMTVTAVVLPVTNQFRSKETIVQTGYKVESGLYARMLKEYQQKMRGDGFEYEDR